MFGSHSEFPAAFKLSALDGSNGFVIRAIARHDFSGRSVSAAGDVNDDGIGDLIVGAPGADATGQGYVVFGERMQPGRTVGGGAEAETLIGTNRADTIVGRAAGDTLKGLAAGDMLRGTPAATC